MKNIDRNLNPGVFNYVNNLLFTDPSYLHKHVQSVLIQELPNFKNMIDLDKDNYRRLMRVSNQLDIMAQYGNRITESFRDENKDRTIVQDYPILKWWRENSFIGVGLIVELIESERTALKE